jgi:dolichol-phosphate mannosyltransferase
VINWRQGRILHEDADSSAQVNNPTSGINAIRVDALRDIDWKQAQAEGYAFQIKLHHTAWKQGYTIKEVPIVFTERREGDSKMSTAISLEAAWRVLRLAAVS